MWPFSRGWGSNSKLANWETEVFELLGNCEALKNFSQVIRHQSRAVQEAYRSKTSFGMWSTFSYPETVERLPFHARWKLAAARDDSGKVSIEVYADEGVVAQFKVTHKSKVADPRKVVDGGLSFSCFAPPRVNGLTMRGWVDELFLNGDLREPRPPIGVCSDEIDSTKLPSDYLELCEQTNGALCGEFVVLGVLDAVPIENDLLAVIDLREMGSVCIRNKSYFLYSGGDPVPLHTGLEAILRRIASGGGLIE